MDRRYSQSPQPTRQVAFQTEHNMFISNVHGKEATNTAAASIGCTAGECMHSGGYGRPGLIGNTFGIKDQLKAAGARWDGACKAWTFESWAALDAALATITAI